MGLDAPLSFSPRFQQYIWGGRNLERILGRTIPDGDVAESWEISAHRAAITVVRGGEFDGTPLDELHARFGDALVGRRGRWATQRGIFPLLIKLLDANRALSVQVHPDDAYARAHEGETELGKTEMWYVLWAREGAEIIYGLKKGTSRESLAAAIREGTLESCLRRVPARTGDAFLIEAGTVHAVLDGVLIAEVQQSSNTTYRVYDWGRAGPDGRPRELHIREALDVIDLGAGSSGPSVPQAVPEDVSDTLRREVIARSDKFVVERVVIPEGESFQGTLEGDTLEIWGVLSGTAAVQGDGGELILSRVSFGLLPATMGPFQVTAQRAVEALRIYLPEVEEG